MKETWKLTNALLNKYTKSTNISSLIEGNTIIQGRRDISNTRNNCFCSIGRELADEVDQSLNPLLLYDYLINKFNKKVNFTEVNEQHIRDAFIKMKYLRAFETIISPVTF